MSARRLSITRDQFRLKVPFTISRGTVHSLELVTAHIEEDGRVGRGECRPYPRYGESMDSVEAEIEHQRRLIEQGAGREQIGNAMRAGAARNAVDNALWDLEAKRAGVPVHELAGLDAPGPTADELHSDVYCSY